MVKPSSYKAKTLTRQCPGSNPGVRIEILIRSDFYGVNKYKIIDNYVIGYTYRRNNPFYFDKEDFDLVSKYYWKLDSKKNVITSIDGKTKNMHSLIMGDGIYIHKNDNNSDNRRNNLVSVKGYHNNGRTILNGYIAVYMPEHHRAFDNGCVYEHILVAEEMLGRELLPEECVHHKDKNRTNNSEDNLMVFATNRDHILYHAGANAIKLENGSYICEDIYNIDYDYNNVTMQKYLDSNTNDSITINKIKSKYNICPICNVNLKDKKAKMCLECYNKEKSKNIPPKEELEKLIYKYPFTEIGKMFNVSDNSVRKWCRKYGLPYRKKDMNNNNN